MSPRVLVWLLSAVLVSALPGCCAVGIGGCCSVDVQLSLARGPEADDFNQQRVNMVVALLADEGEGDWIGSEKDNPDTRFASRGDLAKWIGDIGLDGIQQSRKDELIDVLKRARIVELRVADRKDGPVTVSLDPGDVPPHGGSLWVFANYRSNDAKAFARRIDFTEACDYYVKLEPSGELDEHVPPPR